MMMMMMMMLLCTSGASGVLHLTHGAKFNILTQL